jgi:hypothetical protein
MLDAKGTSYLNSVTLEPFASVILMVDPNPPVPVVPVYEVQSFNNLTPTKVEITYTVTLDANSVPFSINFIVKVNGAARNHYCSYNIRNKGHINTRKPVYFGDMGTIHIPRTRQAFADSDTRSGCKLNRLPVNKIPLILQ